MKHFLRVFAGHDGFSRNRLARMIRNWLEEDAGTGDITSLGTIEATHRSTGIIHAKSRGIVAGLPVAELVFHTIDPEISFTGKKSDGDAVAPGDVIAEIEGITRHLLLGERLALNLLQRLSGIATRTAAYVKAVEGLDVRIVDTRKTTPGLRFLEKYAVRVGGGHNHRFGLFDAVMIKDNHIKAAGGIAQAIASARRHIPHTMKIEVETESREQYVEAVKAGADIIMLDNMSLSDMREAVAYIKEKAPHIVVEASGGVTLERVRAIAETGVDVISVGSLTHSVEALDISMDLDGKKEAGQ